MIGPVSKQKSGCQSTSGNYLCCYDYPAARARLPPASVPFRGDMSPIAGDRASARGDSAPARGDSAPARGDSAPARGDSAPARGDGASARGDGASAGVALSPMADSPSPAAGAMSPIAGDGASVSGNRYSVRGYGDSTRVTMSPPAGPPSPATGNISPLIRSLSIVPGAAFPIAPPRAMNRFSPRPVSFSMQASPRRPPTILPRTVCTPKSAAIMATRFVIVTKKAVAPNSCSMTGFQKRRGPRQGG